VSVRWVPVGGDSRDVGCAHRSGSKNEPGFPRKACHLPASAEHGPSVRSTDRRSGGHGDQPGHDKVRSAPWSHPSAVGLKPSVGGQRARSSVGERSLHTREVAGSSPAVPIRKPLQTSGFPFSAPSSQSRELLFWKRFGSLSRPDLHSGLPTGRWTHPTQCRPSPPYAPARRVFANVA
jgi:hypothetical protein